MTGKLELVDNARSNKNVLTSADRIPGHPLLTAGTVQEALKAAEKAQSDRLVIEEQLRDAGYTVKPGSPTGKHQAFAASSTEAQKLGIDGFTMDQASQYAAKK